MPQIRRQQTWTGSRRKIPRLECFLISWPRVRELVVPAQRGAYDDLSGEPRVNVLALTLALDRGCALSGHGRLMKTMSNGRTAERT
jgi:hypothetical protein